MGPVATVEIQLLGRFSARRAGEEIPPAAFGGRLVRVLVRILVTRRGSFVPRDGLAEALWPERMPADPTTNLRVMVQRARSALGEPALIVTGAGGYSFAAGNGCVVDSEVFLARVQGGHGHLIAGEAAAALREYRSALELWAGEPLAEDVYEDWASAPRAALWRAHLQALEEGAEAALSLRDPGQAVALAERAVAREPLREPAALLLARALAASGDQVAALRAIDGLRRRLGDEVGLGLSAEAVALETRLQRGDAPVAAPRRAVVSRGRGAFEGLTFVGRDDELEAALAALAAPEPGVAVVAGTGGTGKSRLLAEAAERSTLPVLAVRAFLPERNEPWSLARALLREMLALDLEAANAVPDRAAQALADVLPELEEIRSIGSVVVDPESRRALALEGAARLMAVAAGEGAVVVVDDLQWADATSLAVLGVMSRRVPNVGLLLAYRPEEVTADSPVASFLDELRAVRRPLEIGVGPLTPQAIGRLVADPVVAAVIAEETDRTPLAVAETVRSLSAEGVIEADARGRWEPRRPDAAERAREIAHSGQRRAILARAERQPANRRQLLSLLALLGRETPARVLTRSTGAAEGRVLDDLDRLARAGLARLGEAGWAPAHDVIGEAVSHNLERAERGRLHHLLARALEAEGGDPAEVARHLSGAGDRAAAAVAFADAAQRRLVAFAGDEASELATNGLALDPPPETSAGLLRTRAEARALRGDPIGSREDLRAVLASMPRGPDRARALVRVVEVTAALDDYDQAGELIDVALTEAGDDPAARADALTMAAFLDVNRGEIGRAEARAAEALRLFEAQADSAGIAAVLDLRALALLFRGRLVEAVTLFDRAARLYRDSGGLLKIGYVRVMRAWLLVMGGQAEEALGEADEVLELERVLGQTEGQAAALWIRSEILTALGRVEEGRRDAITGVQIARQLGNREALSVMLRALAEAHLAAGDLDQSEAAIREASAVAADIPLQIYLNGAVLADLLLERGDVEQAQRVADETLRRNDGFFAYEGGLVRAAIALARGDPAAEGLAAEALNVTEAGGYVYSRVRNRLAQRTPVPPVGASAGRVRHRERRTFMFTDIVQSTNLVEALGDEAWDHLLHWHDQTLRSLFAEHHGEEVNRIGDGFFVAFERAGDGARCAMAIQRVLKQHRVDHGFAPRVRIGLHYAEATREGADYQGRGVHAAARIAAVAGADEIVASRDALADLDGLRWSEVREVELKGFSEPVEVVSLDWR
jgi:class 3 adenylate cyclase/DNA-binding SARP family transcriptional activator